MKLKKLLIVYALTSPLLTNAAALQRKTINLDGRKFEKVELDEIRCQELFINDTVNFEAQENVIKIVCDKIHFNKGSKLIVNKHLQMKSKFLSGEINVIGKRENINGSNGEDGSEGVNGDKGKDGAKGGDGRAARAGNGATNGSTGCQGQNGVNGSNGGNGEDGFDGKKNVTIDIRSEAFHPESFFFIESLGGNGGRGGEGGRGGNGGHAGAGGEGGRGGKANGLLGQSAGNGGAGGNGGDGGDAGNGGHAGNGGRGGDGGDVYILAIVPKGEAPDRSILPQSHRALEINNYGGQGGAPGVPGVGGVGGNGGNGGRGGEGGEGDLLNGDGDPGFSGVDGEKGKDGLDGKKGVYGEHGERGLVSENLTGFFRDDVIPPFEVEFKTNTRRKSISRPIEIKEFKKANLIELF